MYELLTFVATSVLTTALLLLCLSVRRTFRRNREVRRSNALLRILE